jgi:predicted DNA-binding protein (UPF0251 family)
MLNPETVARIKACQGVYSLSDCARHFGVSKGSVHNVWNGKYHSQVQPANEPDNVRTTRVSKDVIHEDGRVLLERGLNVREAAAELGVSHVTLRKVLKEGGTKLCYFL